MCGFALINWVFFSHNTQYGSLGFSERSYFTAKIWRSLFNLEETRTATS